MQPAPGLRHQESLYLDYPGQARIPVCKVNLIRERLSPIPDRRDRVLDGQIAGKGKDVGIQRSG